MWSTDREYQRFIIKNLTELTDPFDLRVYYHFSHLNDPMKYPLEEYDLLFDINESSKSPEGVQFHIASSETLAEEISKIKFTKDVDLLHPSKRGIFDTSPVLVMEQTLTFPANYTDEMSHNKTQKQFIKELEETILSTPTLRRGVNLLTITIKAF
jgi:hypothetical protein